MVVQITLRTCVEHQALFEEEKIVFEMSDVDVNNGLKKIELPFLLHALALHSRATI